MASTQITVIIKDGVGTTWQARADQNVDNSIAMHVVPEIGGAAIGPTNAMPVKPIGVSSVVSQSLESSHVLSSTACNFYGLQVWAGSSAYVLVFDAAAVPGDGAVTPRKVYQINSSQSNLVDVRFNPPLAMQNGVAIALSTTGPFAKSNAGNIGFISGEVGS